MRICNWVNCGLYERLSVYRERDKEDPALHFLGVKMWEGHFDKHHPKSCEYDHVKWEFKDDNALDKGLYKVPSLTWTYLEFPNERHENFSLSNVYYTNACRYVKPYLAEDSSFKYILSAVRANLNDMTFDYYGLDQGTHEGVAQIKSKGAKVTKSHGSVLEAHNHMLHITGCTFLTSVLMRSQPVVHALEVSTRASMDQLLDHVPFELSHELRQSLLYDEKINLIKSIVKDESWSGTGYGFDDIRWMLPACFPTSYVISFDRKELYSLVLNLYKVIDRVSSSETRYRLEKILFVIASHAYNKPDAKEPVAKSHKTNHFLPSFSRHRLDEDGMFVSQLRMNEPRDLNCSSFKTRLRDHLLDLDSGLDAWNLLDNEEDSEYFLSRCQIDWRITVSVSAMRDLNTHRPSKFDVLLFDDPADKEAAVLHPYYRWLYSNLLVLGEEQGWPTVDDFVNIYLKGQTDSPLSDRRDPTYLWTLNLGSPVVLNGYLHAQDLLYIIQQRIQPDANAEYLSYCAVALYQFVGELNEEGERDAHTDTLNQHLVLYKVFNIMLRKFSKTRQRLSIDSYVDRLRGIDASTEDERSKEIGYMNLMIEFITEFYLLVAESDKDTLHKQFRNVLSLNWIYFNYLNGEEYLESLVSREESFLEFLGKMYQCSLKRSVTLPLEYLDNQFCIDDDVLPTKSG